MAGVGRPISYHAGGKPYQLRVQFAPEWLTRGQTRPASVKPRMGALSGPEALFTDASTFVLENRSGDAAGQNLAAQAFPGRSWEHQHIVIFVSARSIQQSSPAAVARDAQGDYRGR